MSRLTPRRFRHSATSGVFFAILTAVLFVAPFAAAIGAKAITLSPAGSTGNSNTVGDTVNIQFTASGGTAPYTWSVSAGVLPTGLTLSSSGLVNGTWTTPGAWTFTITATDSTSATGSATFSGTTAAAPSILTITSPAAGNYVSIINTTASVTFLASGGTGPYTWAVATGTLPTGLTLSSSSGLLSGTYAALGAFPLTIRVTDSLAATATASYTITVANPVTITPTALPALAVGTATTVTFTATGGSGSGYTFARVGDSPVPAGLTLSSAGVLSGTPTTAGSYLFGVRATDSSGDTGDIVYSGTIAVPVPTMPIWMLFGLAVLLIGIAARRLTTTRALGK